MVGWGARAMVCDGVSIGWSLTKKFHPGALPTAGPMTRGSAITGRRAVIESFSPRRLQGRPGYTRRSGRLLSVAVFVSNLLVCRGERDEEVPAPRVGRITGSYLSGSAALTAWAIGRLGREREELPRARWRCGFPRWPVFRWRARQVPAAAR